MRGISRRALLLGTGSLWVSARARSAGTGKGGGGRPIPPAPVARVAEVHDTYFGETLTDYYRWMENDQDPEWLAFLRGQNAHARAVLDAIPGREALLRRIGQLSGDAALTRHAERAGGRLFYEQRPAGAENFKLFVREGAVTRTLIDPTQLATAAGHQSLDWWLPSPDGTHLVYGLSRDGSEDSVLHVLDVARGTDLPERIGDTQLAEPSWLPDGSGFFYNQLTARNDTPERYLDSQARLHRLGSDPASDPVLMRRGQDARVAYDRIQMPHILAFPGADHVLLRLADVREEARLYIAPLAEVLAARAAWQPVADFEDEVTGAALEGGTLYLLAARGHPRGRVLRASTARPAIGQATEVVPESAWVIEDLHVAADGLYLRMLDGGVSRLKRLGRDAKLTEVLLPYEGAVTSMATESGAPGALFSFGGWLESADIWTVDAALHAAATGLNPRPPLDTSPYETTRLFATVRDGTRVPYTLLHRRGLKPGTAAPALIHAYGSYGTVAYRPTLTPRLLALVDAGCVVGFAGVRGGGEYGRDWHRAGQLANKPNTWRDLIDVCLDLCARGYSTSAQLAIAGRSAGGITVGRALTERPELFAAVIDGVGWSNPLRYVAEQNGYGEEPEWGRIDEEQGYRALKAIDSYQAVRPGVAYPAVLLTTGVTDPRVAPFHVGKMTARLQACSSSGKPVLLRVDFDAGHGIGSTRAQQDREAADTYAFLLWQTGAQGFRSP